MQNQFWLVTGEGAQLLHPWVRWGCLGAGRGSVTWLMSTSSWKVGTRPTRESPKQEHSELNQPSAL